MSLKDIWKKIVAIVGVIVAIWLISPIPEVSIIVGLFGGKTLSYFIPTWAAYSAAIAGAIIGFFIVRRLNLIEKIKKRSQKEDE